MHSSNIVAGTSLLVSNMHWSSIFIYYFIIQVCHVTCTLGLLSHVAPCMKTENGLNWIKSSNHVGLCQNCIQNCLYVVDKTYVAEMSCNQLFD